MTKTQNYWKRLTSTLWFLPMLLAICGILLGLTAVAIDVSIGAKLGYFPRFFGIEPSGATNVLAIIAGSTITIAGTVYSITIVALTLASTQFSPRILRNFMRDSGNQIVLGVMVGIFAYCIVVLRTIRAGGDDAESFVPTIAVMLGVIMGLVGVGCLIYFIHHVAVSIQATSIISTVAKDTIHEVKKNYLFEYDSEQYDKTILAKIPKSERILIPSSKTGYIQNADTDKLLELAEKYDLIVQMRRRIGEFSIESLPLLQVYARSDSFRLDEKKIKEFSEAYDIGNFRTVEGDVAFGIRQIVDIALKALSPAINDTTTGISCIDYLTAIMVCLAQRPSRPPLYFSQNNLRLVANPQRFEDYFDLAFNQIRQNSSGNVAIILRLIVAIEVLGKINRSLEDEERIERHSIFETQVKLLREVAEKTVSAKPDLETVIKRYNEAEKVLENLKQTGI